MPRRVRPESTYSAPVRFGAARRWTTQTATLRAILARRHGEERAAIAANDAAGSFEYAA